MRSSMSAMVYELEVAKLYRGSTRARSVGEMRVCRTSSDRGSYIPKSYLRAYQWGNLLLHHAVVKLSVIDGEICYLLLHYLAYTVLSGSVW